MHIIDNMILSSREDSTKCGIYNIINNIDNKIYIGSVCSPKNGRNSFRRRWLFHLNRLLNNNHYNSHLQNAFNKYGLSSFSFNIIEIINDKTNVDLILQREQYYLDLYKSYNHDIGYNILKTSINLKINNKIKEQTKDKIRKSTLGKPRPLWMKHLYGKPILQYTLDNEFIKEWYSTTEAARELKIHRTGIKDALKGKNKTAGGFKWIYKEKQLGALGNITDIITYKYNLSLDS